MSAAYVRPALHVFGLLATLATVHCGSSTPSTPSTSTTPANSPASSGASAVSTIDLSPNPCLVGHSSSIQLKATATLANGSKEPITESSGVKWSSSDVTKATVTESGNVVGVSLGDAKIEISYEGATGTVDCLVGP